MEKINHCLLVMPMLFHGGAEKQFRFLIEALNDDSNFRLSVLSLQKYNTENDQRFMNENKYVSFYSLNISDFTNKKNKLICIFKFINWLLKNKKIYKKNAVIIFNLTGLMMVPLFKSNKCNVIFSERNSGEKIVNKIFKRRMLYKCDYLTCNSTYAKKTLEKKLGKKVIYIRNGIKIIPLTKPSSNEKILLVPARISRIKNQLFVCKTMNILEPKGWLLLLAGPIEDKEYYNEIVQYIKDNNLNSIKILGNVENIIEIYKQSSLVILPSLSEGTPNVILESFLLGKLCLASNIEMNKNCFQDSKFIFNLNDSSELIRKIELIDNINEIDKQRIRKENYEYVCKNYALDNMTSAYKKIIKMLE